jgi:hypothetical protein
MGRAGATLLLAIGSFACTGEIERDLGLGAAGGAPGPGASPPPGPGSEPVGAAPSETVDPVRGCTNTPLPQRRAVKLSDRQYKNAVRALLGPVLAPASAALEAVRTPGASSDLFLEDPTIGGVDEALAGQYQRAAEAIGQAAAARWSEVMPCPDAPAKATTCVRGWLEDFVGRAIRRPLTADEVNDYGRLYEQGAAGGAPQGVRLVLTAVLQSPSFLYRRELGGPATATRVALTDFEMASQLSLWLRDSLPDPQLWQAAKAGRLSAAASLKVEVERLLADQNVRDNLTSAVLRWFEAPGILQSTKDEKRFPWFAGARESYFESARLLVVDTLWTPPGDLQRLFTSPVAFVDTKIAPAFGLPAPKGAGFTRVEAPAGERAGIITHPAFLAYHASPTESQVVHRGVALRRDVLCQDLPPPPPGLDVDPPKPGITEREFADYRGAQAACKTCHALIDPLGLMLEGYDAVGAHRSSIAGRPIDTSGPVVDTDFDGVVQGGVALAERLGRSKMVAGCVVNHMLAYAIARPLAPASCTLQKLREVYDSEGHRLVPLLTAIALSDEFRFRRP